MEEGNTSSFSNCGLQWCLRQLGQEEFQIFKDFLKGNASELATHSFPWDDLDNTNEEHLASLLHEHCQRSLVWKVAANIFQEMSLPALTQKARDEMEKCSLAELLGDSTPAKTEQETNMDEVAGHGDDEWDYKCHVVTKFSEILNTHHDFTTFASDCLQTQPLFDAFTPDQSGFRPLTVVLHGRSGVGKSALARRILLHWAHGELYPGMFSYAFLLNARYIQLQKKSSFEVLISREWPGSPVPMMKIMSQPEKLLFVVDSFDDLDVAFQDAHVNLCADWAEKQPVYILIHSLLKKVLLPEASLIVTVRDVGLEKLKSMVISPHYLFVKGISVERRIQLFLEHIKNEDQKKQVLQSVVDNHRLIDRCHVSIMWWLICQVFEVQASSGKSLPSSNCPILTNLYATFVIHQLTPQDVPGHCLSPEERVVLKGLCQMAVEGVWGMKFVFYDDDLGIHGLTELELSTLFRRNILLQAGQGERCFTFLHLSLQEFFAALYYVLKGLEADWNPHPLCVENMKTWKEIKEISSNIHLLHMRHFLFGLMNREVVRILEDLLGCPIALEVRHVLLDWISLLGQQATVTTSPLDFLESFYCLFETQDEEFVHLALNSFREVRLMINQQMDLMVSCFCLRHCRHLQKIRVDVREIFPEDESTEAWPIILQGMKIKSTVKQCWENFCFVLGSHPSLQQLDLSGSILNEWAMKTLCIKLRWPTCKIQKLIFKSIQITLGLHHLWKTVIINPNIKYLSLESTHLKDDDIEIAYQALKHPNCLLESLRLDHCGLTHTCCLPISRTLRTSTCLKSLSLARNKVTNQGILLLCEALKVSQCSLQKLMLGSCGLRTAACRDLASVLLSNQTLTHLDLSSNNLGTEGVALLCQALKLFTCALQRLILRECHLDVGGCGFLALALTSNRHLTHLSLSMNPLGDNGVNLLCEVIVEASCHLQDLELMKCHLTAACCENLSHVITRSTHLRSLDLSDNALGDSGAAALCEGLKLRTSLLKRLGLEACELTSDCCEILSSALFCNQHLSHLNLIRNHFFPEGMKKLCQAFKHPTSNLQVIGLWKWQYPDETRKLLEEVQLQKPHVMISDHWYTFDEDDRYWWKN